MTELHAIAQHAAGLLADHIAIAMDTVPASSTDASTARSRLLAACVGHLDFATENPGLYRAIFISNEQIDELTSPSERARGATGDGGYNLLVASLQDVMTATGGAPMNPWDPVAILSTLHGLAMLRIDAALRSMTDEQFAATRARVLETITAAIPLDTLAHISPAESLDREDASNRSEAS